MTCQRKTTMSRDLTTTTPTKWPTYCFAVSYRLSETIRPNSMKLYRWLPCMTCNRKTTRSRDLTTTTPTTWPTLCFALSYYPLKLYGKIQ